MNFRLFVKTFIYSLAVLCTITFLIFSTVKDEPIPQNSTNAPESAKDTSNEIVIPDKSTLSHYMLKLDNGIINIYEVYSDETKIKRGSIDIPTETLREIDRINFEHGIIVQSTDDILHITEDFAS